MVADYVIAACYPYLRLGLLERYSRAGANAGPCHHPMTVCASAQYMDRQVRMYKLQWHIGYITHLIDCNLDRIASKMRLTSCCSLDMARD